LNKARAVDESHEQRKGWLHELLKVIAVIVGGFLFSLYSTAFSVLGVKKLTSPAPKEKEEETNEQPMEILDINPPPVPKAFSDETVFLLRSTALLSAVVTIITKRMGLDVADDLARVFLLSLTLSTFTFGARLSKKFTKIIHPLLTCTGLNWAAMWQVSKFMVGSSFTSQLLEYKSPNGAGPILLGFLGPSVVSLACQMFDRRKLIKENIVQIAAAILVSSFGG